MGVTLSLAKFNRSSRSTAYSRTATVQCGVRNLAISEAAAPHGLYYAPDPSSQIACTIGGNVAENSGGVHRLKYGLTLHNVLRVRGFTVEGEPVEFGSGRARCAGAGPAGRRDRQRGHAGGGDRGHRQADPEAEAGARCIMASLTTSAGGDAVAAIIAAGIIPAGLEMMDKPMTACGRGLRARRLRPQGRRHPAVRKRRHAGGGGRGDRACSTCSGAAPRAMEVSKDEAQRLKFWSGRKNAFPASGRISPTTCAWIRPSRASAGRHPAGDRADGEKYQLRCANVFHAGDGNLHPLIPVRCQRPRPAAPLRAVRRRHPRDQRADGRHGHRRARRGRREASTRCVQFTPGERLQMMALKHAFDPPACQPGQGDPDAAALRRAREDAREEGPAAVPRTGAVLSAGRGSPEVLAQRIRDAAARKVVAQHPRRRATRVWYGEAPRASRWTPRLLTGISSYEPTELVVTARAGTRSPSWKPRSPSRAMPALRAAASFGAG